MAASVSNVVYPALPSKIDAPTGLSAAQLQANRDPSRPVRELLGERFIGDPYLVWKDDPALAHQINDELAKAANKRR